MGIDCLRSLELILIRQVRMFSTSKKQIYGYLSAYDSPQILYRFDEILPVYSIDSSIRDPYYNSIAEKTGQNTDSLSTVLSFLGSALVQLSSRSRLCDLAFELQGRRPSVRPTRLTQ
ncbi:hypothetical protein [Burkholderia pseudomallei]|uniref:hypothetical protein n=1 Tax=Burkholderia pseudomallei TaxID=28450 RepID=UPI00100BA680|nr:hypothetical protein [Burkholderia pseudomallei]